MLIWFLLGPGLRDHWVLARLHSHLLPEGRTYFMCYVMSLMFVHDMHPHAHSSYVLLASSMRAACNLEFAGDARTWFALVRTHRTGPCDLQAWSVELCLCSEVCRYER